MSDSATAPDPTPPPPLLPGQPPIAILVDFDGTIALTDVADQVLIRFMSPARLDEDNAGYEAGLVGTRTLFERQVRLLPGDPRPAQEIADAQPLDETFAAFALRALRFEIPIEVVSDGFGFYVQPALDRLGVPPIPVITAVTTFHGPSATMSFPNGHPDCFVCGTCKRQRVLAHQRAGRAVVFIGDGESDRYAAAYSDLIFAKDRLVDLCRAEGWAFEPWQDFAGLERWLDSAVSAWRSGSGSLPRHRPRPFICGPEVWGPGLNDPPPGFRRPQH